LIILIILSKHGHKKPLTFKLWAAEHFSCRIWQSDKFELEIPVILITNICFTS
jgi:hypothetical protein